MSEKKYSQARAMFAITRASFRGTLRNPSAIIFTIVFPLVFIVVFGFIRPGNISIDVGVDPKCDTAGVIFQSLKNIPGVHLQTDKPAVELEKQLFKGRLDAILNITKDVTKNPPVQIVNLSVSNATRDNGAVVKSIIGSVIDKYNLNVMSKIVEHSKEYIPSDYANAVMTAELKENVLEGRTYHRIDFILPGQLGFAILGSGVFGTAFVFFNMRQTQVLKRFFATPVRRSNILVGETLSRIVFQIIAALLLIVVGKFAFGFTLIHGIATATQMLLLTAFGLIVFMGFGFFVSGIAPSESIIPPLSNLFTLPQLLLSGTFFSTEAFPPWLQGISNILPLTHLNEGLRRIAFEGAALWDVRFHILVLVLWGIGIYALAGKFFRWE